MQILQFSGGKDSLACLHLSKDLPDLVAFWVDTGGGFPHMRQFVIDACARANVPLHIVRTGPTVQEWQAKNGVPVDILPIDATVYMSSISDFPAKIRMTPYIACCSANIWQPMQDAILVSGAKTVIRGSKKADARHGVGSGYTDENGIAYLSPLWDWTDDDVFSYLKDNNVELPPQYAMGADSLDCWHCTAYMDGHHRKRFEYMKTHYPDLHAEVKQTLKLVNETLIDAAERISLDI